MDGSRDSQRTGSCGATLKRPCSFSIQLCSRMTAPGEPPLLVSKNTTFCLPVPFPPPLPLSPDSDLVTLLYFYGVWQTAPKQPDQRHQEAQEAAHLKSASLFMGRDKNLLIVCVYLFPLVKSKHITTIFTHRLNVELQYIHGGAHQPHPPPERQNFRKKF